MQRLAIFALILAIPLTARAEALERLTERDRFLSTVVGKDLTRLGITLNVSPDGEITGRAFGRDVTGAWSWNGGYFCRDLFFGERDLGYNCQLVEAAGGTIRFTSDEGTGMSADFSLN